MRAKLKLIFVVLILVILFSGCNLLQPKKPEAGEPEKIEYHIGTEALKMSFLKNFPPDEIREGQPFQIIIEVINQGAYDISKCNLTLTGLKEQYTKIVEGSSKQTIKELKGKSIEFPVGDKELVTFKAKNERRLPLDKHKELIRIDACYKYETKASADICINPTSYVSVPQTPTVCAQNQQIGIAGGQGAPISVTRIEQNTIPLPEQGKYELELKFHIANLGKGIVYGENGCKKGGFLTVDNIIFSKFSLNSGITCEFKEDRLVVLDKKDNVLKCKTEIDSSMGSFITPLQITLSYWYEDKIEKTIEVLKSL